MFLESDPDVVELLVDFRIRSLERVEVAVLVALGVFVNGARSARSGHHVLPLSVDEVFAVKGVLAGGGIAGEGDARVAVVAEVPEHHRLNVDGGPPIVGDLLDAAVFDGAFPVPGGEDGAEAAPKLFGGIVGESDAEDLFDLGFEGGGKFFEIGGGEFRVEFDASFAFLLLQQFLEDFANRFPSLVLDARGFLHDDVGVHHDEASVGVVSEPFVARFRDETGERLLGQAEVEDRVHHTGHRHAGAGTDGDEEGVFRVAEFRPMIFSTCARACLTCLSSSGGYFLPFS